MKLTHKKVAPPDPPMPDTIVGDVLRFPKYIFGMQFKTGAERQYEGWYKGYRVLAILFTRRKGDSWGKGKFTYAIDKEKKIYKTVDELMYELNKRTLSVTPG
jgi:hypothetical protein